MYKNAKKLLVKAIAFCLITNLLACNNTPQANQEANKITPPLSGLLDVATITENVDSFVGQSVLVRNDIVEIIGTKGLILDKDRAFGGDNILVISISQLSPILLETETPEVIVTGTVQRFNLNNLQQQYSLNLDAAIYAQYANQPVIIAESLMLSPDPEDLTLNPEVYYDQPLAVKGELEDLENYGIFELDEEQAFGGEDLLVVQLKPRIQLKQEQTAIIYGTLRPFVAIELEQDYDLGWDLSVQKQVEAKYFQKPVLIAEKIQILK